ncbi:urease accessory protein UreF [Flavitalea sp. BT771]|uniref:urease accessory protein UreF n=1 Tax=Flavitalea sp. BT771 TaxID=3063329 RepID=UPI0026E256F4|nr:urease accessory protein UreF [Flavitalea sp. BT771]MDO6431910.1 urease accessory protein UreF [Flavitalea sp. BT771]MDV6220819.1 urease accessory protein UreF [Flavitalea sp. BT771]
MNLLGLLQLSDPALPIGGYAHSGGLETYVQAGIVCDPVSAGNFVQALLRTSVHYTDAALVALAFKAVRAPGELSGLDQLCEAVKLPREMREASRKLGGRLGKIFEGLVGPASDGCFRFPRHYPVAFGYCAARLGIGLREALTGYYYNAAAGIVTNCVKLIPMGQQDGQVLLFSLQPLITELVEQNLEPDRELIGMCCVGLDIRCMQHEQLYSRLYMS